MARPPPSPHAAAPRDLRLGGAPAHVHRRVSVLIGFSQAERSAEHWAPPHNRFARPVARSPTGDDASASALSKSRRRGFRLRDGRRHGHSASPRKTRSARSSRTRSPSARRPRSLRRFAKGIASGDGSRLAVSRRDEFWCPHIGYTDLNRPEILGAAVRDVRVPVAVYWPCINVTCNGAEFRLSTACRSVERDTHPRVPTVFARSGLRKPLASRCSAVSLFLNPDLLQPLSADRKPDQIRTVADPFADTSAGDSMA